MEHACNLWFEAIIWNRKFLIDNTFKDSNLKKRFNTLKEALEAFPFRINELILWDIPSIKDDEEELDELGLEELWVNEKDYILQLMWLIAEENPEIKDLLLELGWNFQYRIKKFKTKTIH
jgi:hypothetical protein